MTRQKPPIYISYAWGKSETASEEQKMSEGVCAVLKEHGFTVIKDTDYLKYLEKLPSFFKTIGQGGYVVPIVGQKYLHSENCLSEASYMVEKGNLDKRLFPIILSDSASIYSSEGRKTLTSELLEYWENKKNDLVTALKTFDYEPGYEGLRADAFELTKFISRISTFINSLGKSLQLSPQQHLEENFKTLIGAIDKRFEEDCLTAKHFFQPGPSAYYSHFSTKYFGRNKDIDLMLQFFKDKTKHFLLLYGIGGMGKSHMLSECFKEIEQPFCYAECTSIFDLNHLLKICEIEIPKEIETPESKCEYFLQEFAARDLWLVLDDFYETKDADIRGLLSKMIRLPRGKILIVSRTIPGELARTGIAFEKHELPPLDKDNFFAVIRDYVTITDAHILLTDGDIKKIYEKTQGYPLGGQLIIRLLDLGIDIEELLEELPRFESQLDPEGKEFSGRLLDNLFTRGNKKEIDLLCEFSSFFGASPMNLIKILPSFGLKAFDDLCQRRRFIWKDSRGFFNCHALIKDFAYSRLSYKETIHRKVANYFENELKNARTIDWEIANSAIQHYKQLGQKELKTFGQRMYEKFRNRDVKSLAEETLEKTIRNYTSLINVYENYLPYYNELGITYRENNRPDLAIEIFKKAIEKDPEQLYCYNELGITYRENKQHDLAIEIFRKAIDTDSKHLPCYNELGITYREINRRDLAIETFQKAIEKDPGHLPCYNELGITYRENNQHDLAIKILSKAIEKNPLASCNELAITYRENDQIEEAISVCNKHLIENSKDPILNLNLLQIYLFFEPNKERARKYFEILSLPPQSFRFKSHKSDYGRLIKNLDIIHTLSTDDFSVYNAYLARSIRYRAYNCSVRLLKGLNEKFPRNSRFVGALGKTLSNQVINEIVEGRRYLKEVIELLKKENNQKETIKYIFYYFYNLLNNNEFELLEAELQFYQNDIKDSSAYYRFIANYKQKTNKPVDEIVKTFEQAYYAETSKEEKIIAVCALLNYLVLLDNEDNQDKIEEWRKIRERIL